MSESENLLIIANFEVNVKVSYKSIINHRIYVLVHIRTVTHTPWGYLHHPGSLIIMSETSAGPDFRNPKRSPPLANGRGAVVLQVCPCGDRPGRQPADCFSWSSGPCPCKCARMHRQRTASLTRLVEAKASSNIVFGNTKFRSAPCRGSDGGLFSPSRTTLPRRDQRSVERTK